MSAEIDAAWARDKVLLHGEMGWGYVVVPPAVYEAGYRAGQVAADAEAAAKVVEATDPQSAGWSIEDALAEHISATVGMPWPDLIDAVRGGARWAAPIAYAAGQQQSAARVRDLERAVQGLLQAIRQGFRGSTVTVEDSTITLALWADGYGADRSTSLGVALDMLEQAVSADRGEA